MNESIFLTSFLSNQRGGSKFLTSAAILVENLVVSNREIIVTPLRPSHRPFHVSSVPVPSAVTNPTPVTTTLLFCKVQPLECGKRSLLGAARHNACAPRTAAATTVTTISAYGTRCN